ncbi:peroxisomal membrane protein PEX16 [Gaeumannomyces tritici R3-111a-1]|uniref:Peroxisomal membrane protein PEX16 n=1 Tax=Gaeumannomyces tritici (strain R3-111a-1) TaxID=644352 RepID=J3NUD5_GAET3|nr:peroxisomal membrane protein PEX16 [Gaeumannomyces tritici R3-111a-1]EJT79808.1 peroxisomal membrane protein PEX16 [Gaeumannomyces tritici R3-111a-1]
MAAPAQPSEAPSAPAPGAAAITTKSPKPARKLGVRAVLSLPQTYASFIAKNQSQVSQIESALRSLTYIIPGRFRDAEIASEAIHSGVQLLSLYHDSLLERAAAAAAADTSPPSPSSSSAKSKAAPSRSIHTRYTSFWSQNSAMYRRVARALQIVQYTQLLVEMAARRRGDDRLRWRLVVLVEAFKALCRLILLRITRGRPLLTPALPERQPIPQPDDDDDDDGNKSGEYVIPPELRDDDGGDDDHHHHHRHKETSANGHANGTATAAAAHAKDWHMPRTHSVLPSLPDSADINSYLLSRVLTADDIKPAPKLLRPLAGAAQAAEVLHILAPLAYAMALAHFSLRGTPSSAGKKSRAGPAATWAPWALGLALSVAARQLRDRGLRATALEREEWSRRGWGLGWWAMRGAAYDGVVKGVIGGVKRRLPGFVGGILDDYEYLWETYYFSTAD